MTRIGELAGTGDAAITALLDAAFGPARHGRTAYRIRLGMAWFTDLSFAAFDSDGQLIGTLQSWPVALHGPDGRETPLIMVGPVAVVPAMQRHGTGRALMDRLIETVDLHPGDPLVMIGDPEYYGRFWGFSADATGDWAVPGPVERHRLLTRAAPGVVLPSAGSLGPRGTALVAGATATPAV
ncbi:MULTISPECIES: GNAT family N-acetyltransferase [unclassified Sphingobium]|uniref:GNAT family N-acetyltransferase n=1 Tax=unclassified Sphingobium TaxID=2611147 RepID=UPI00222506DE|nr:MULTISPECIES: N-acetyltransferase [unclassified Sphingobium]MCW2410294.1 putative N-acetyltransferase YhbS [Sphingobium sp. B8D3D]MCW2414014.1 putative N-acetyltransferase YhbS [Sphingobium sp. B8D3A]